MSVCVCVVPTANTNTSQFLHFRRLLLLLWCSYRKHNKYAYIHVLCIENAPIQYVYVPSKNLLECMKTISWIRLVLHPQFHWKTFQASSKLNCMKTPSVSQCLFVRMSVRLNQCVGDFHWSQANKSIYFLIFGCTLLTHTHVRAMRWQNCFAGLTWHEKPAFPVILRTK